MSEEKETFPEARGDNKKRDRKRKGKGSKEPKKPYGSTGTFRDNDISWWAASDQLLNDVARLPFGRPLGSKISLPVIGDVNGGKLNAKAIVPGICVINYTNSIGVSLDASSPVNIASRAMYSFVRHANSGHTNYESPDLMMYLLAVSEVYTAIAFLQKVYGVAMYWSQRNRYFGDTLLKSLGFDSVSIRDNLAQFRTGINVLAMKANSLAAPKSLPIFERRYFLASHIYKDQDNEKAQLYTFKPVALNFFSGTALSTGSALVPVTTPWAAIGYASYDQAIDFVDSMLDRLIAEEDIGIMAGDILKAFGDGEMHHLISLPDTYVCTPTYNEEMLQQIHNMSLGVYKSGYDVETFESLSVTVDSTDDITETHGGGIIGQLNGSIIAQPSVRAYTQKYNKVRFIDATANVYFETGTVRTSKVSNMIIDSHLDNPSPADVMIATRLAFTFDSGSSYLYSGASHYGLQSCGLEVVNDIVVITGVGDSVSYEYLSTKCISRILPNVYYYQDDVDDTVAVYTYDANDGSAAEDVSAALKLLNFRKAPLLLLDSITVKYDSDESEEIYDHSIEFFQEVEVLYSAVDDSLSLASINEVALLSVFKIPQLGMWRP